MNWFTNLFKKKEVPPRSLLSFTVEQVPADDKIAFDEDKFFAGLNLKDGQGFIEFLRNSDYNISVTEYSDQELAHLFVYMYTQRWLTENLKKPMFVETHSFVNHGEIRYDRAWNASFIAAVSKLPFEVLPNSEEELVEVYLNYVYGTRMMEEMDAAAEADPLSTAHPELTDPSHRFKG